MSVCASKLEDRQPLLLYYSQSFALSGGCHITHPRGTHVASMEVINEYNILVGNTNGWSHLIDQESYVKGKDGLRLCTESSSLRFGAGDCLFRIRQWNNGLWISRIDHLSEYCQLEVTCLLCGVNKSRPDIAISAEYVNCFSPFVCPFWWGF